MIVIDKLFVEFHQDIQNFIDAHNFPNDKNYQKVLRII